MCVPTYMAQRQLALNIRLQVLEIWYAAEGWYRKKEKERKENSKIKIAYTSTKPVIEDMHIFSLLSHSTSLSIMPTSFWIKF